MARTISVRLEEPLLRELSFIEKQWQADRSEAIRRLLVRAISSWKVQDALEKLRKHKTSIGKAANECGLSLWEMFDMIKQEDIDWTGYSKEDAEKDIKLLEGKR